MKTIIQRINDLAYYPDIKNHHYDIVFDIICKLRESHSDASKSEYSKQELYDLIFVKSDCLAMKEVSDFPEKMLEEIRNLQHEIVDTYGFQD